MSKTIYITRVFSSEHAAGSLTGVSLNFDRDPQDRNVFQCAARQLGLPDTGFLNQSISDVSWTLESYSPVEPMKFCIQTLLSSAAVQKRIAPDISVRSFATKMGAYVVEEDGFEPNVWWVNAEVPSATVASEGLVSSLSELGFSAEVLRNTAAISGIGRRRIYLKLDSEDELERISLSAREVNLWCKKNDLTAICLFFVCSKESIRFRVFTTSLSGEEDVATGGAALGLLSVDSALGVILSDRVVVNQGRGDSLFRGEILLKRANDRIPAKIGGLVQILTEGVFFPKS